MEAREESVCVYHPTRARLTTRILKRLCSELKVSDDIDFRALAKLTPGYVAADLNALTAEAGVIAIRRFFEDMMAARAPQPVVEGMEQMVIEETASSTYIPATDIRHTPLSRFILAFPPPLQADQLGALPLRSDDFEAALKVVQPSAKREGFATIPDVSWSDVGALQNIRDELHYAIVEPIRRPERFMKFGIDAPSGVLLWGPPGCGKTLLAKAVANESRANFISVKGPELLNKVSLDVRRSTTDGSMSERVNVPFDRFSPERGLPAHVSSFSTSLTLSYREETIRWYVRLIHLFAKSSSSSLNPLPDSSTHFSPSSTV